jgi:hypothetical protein
MLDRQRMPSIRDSTTASLHSRENEKTMQIAQVHESQFALYGMPGKDMQFCPWSYVSGRMRATHLPEALSCRDS